MSGQSSGQTLRTSTSFRPSTLTFPDTSNRPNVNGDRDIPSREGPEDNAVADVAEEGWDEHLHRRHRPRGSGGFLLQPTPATQLHRATSSEPEISEIVKGKRKVEDGDLIIPKRASARQRHRQKPSLGSSPLALEVSNAQVSGEPDGLVRSTKKSAPARNTTQDVKEILKTSTLANEQAYRDNERSAIGFDTDPAQIVNLALNLSESRRRNFSSGSHLVPREAIGARRPASTGQPTLALPNNTAGGSLRQHLQQQRRISRNVSPRSSSSVSGKGPGSPMSQKESPVNRRASVLPRFGTEQLDDVAIDASEATFARVEKARNALELAYEYRRLLQYLPKLRRPSRGNKVSPKSQSLPAEELGRIYNPLQYIRNRKVRFNEKRPLDTEGDGWTVVDNVRPWVDTVALEREDGLSRVDNRFPLPPFDTYRRGLAITDSTHVASPQARKIPRPHTVWEFAASDLLADAYWLQQNDNATHIEDPMGNKLFRDRRSDQANDPRMSKESTRDPARRSESKISLNRSPERLIRASIESFRSESKERGRRLLERKEPRSPTSDGNGSQTRRSRWPRKFVRSRSPSSSGESRGAKRRGHKLGHEYLGSRDDYDNAALEKHMMEMLAREADDSDGITENINEHAAEIPESGPGMLDTRKANGQIAQIPKRRPSAPQRMRTDMPAAVKHEIAARASLDEQRFAHYRMSSDDLDSTAPNSPTASGFVPSIAINLSPPASPPVSKPSPRKPLPVSTPNSHRNRSPSAHKRAVSENDLDLDSGASADISRQNTNESQLVNMLRKERSTAPSNGLLSPKKTDSSRGSIRSMKEGNIPDSRFRGLFKGGRIAELVGSEVSRVGDMLWKRDSNNYSTQTSSPAASSFASDESDVDDGDMSAPDSSPQDNALKRNSKVEKVENIGGLSRLSTNSEKPKYHMSNLPSFQSSMTQDRRPAKSIKSTADHDHITRQQLALRERGRSSRFDRLAPPKIDMRGISPSPSRSPSPERAVARAIHDKDSRESSSSRSGRRVRSADRRLNALLNVPGKVGTGMVAPTGLSRLAARQQDSRGRPTLSDKRQWSISDRGVSAVRGTITKRDIARVRALLLSSGVKANEIARRAEEKPPKPSHFLQELEDLFKGNVPHLPRSQEYVAAGRMLVSNIEMTIQQLRATADDFAHNTVDKLHQEIKNIDDRVNYKLTPFVRAAADDADAFSTELTTTHTLAVKQLNDSVDAILRRRRRRLRWIRRWGWAMVEWTLLGIMWMVWFAVVVVQLVRSVIAVFMNGLRWLFWL